MAIGLLRVAHGRRDLADLFRRLPDDRAQLPRWGYVIKGKGGLHSGTPDGEETYAHFRPVDGGFAYRIVVEYETRSGLRGVLDGTVVRGGTDRAVRQTMTNLERLLGPLSRGRADALVRKR